LENLSYQPGGGNVKIYHTKTNWTSSSRVGSLENLSYKPKDSEVKIKSQKLKWKSEPKIGSMTNKDYKPGGGKVKIVHNKLKWKAEPKIKSLENLNYTPRTTPSGTDSRNERKTPVYLTEVDSDKENAKESSKSKKKSTKSKKKEAGRDSKGIQTDSSSVNLPPIKRITPRSKPRPGTYNKEKKGTFVKDNRNGQGLVFNKLKPRHGGKYHSAVQRRRVILPPIVGHRIGQTA